MQFPHERIRDQQDRSWTTRLIEQLRVADGFERMEIGHTLHELADPRAVAPLRAVLLDRDLPGEAREVAGELLRDQLGDEPTDATLRGWWHDGDPVLREHALQAMGPGQADLVLAVAAEPSHPQHAAAINALSFGFSAPAHQRLKIAALEHPDAAVRHTAAGILVWDEPVAAEATLVVRLDDLVSDVARSAAATLCWYRTRRALRELASRPNLLDDATGDHEGIAMDFVDELRRLPPAARPAFERWLAPVADLLADELAEPELDPDDDDLAPDGPDLGEIVDVDRLLAALEAIDGPWAATRERLHLVRAELVEPIERSRLARAAAAHADPDVRSVVAGWLGRWGDTAGLRALFADPSFVVRKTAGWALGLLAPDRSLAPLLRAHLDAVDTTGTHADEVLYSYVVHAERADAIATLAELARDPAREGLAFVAVHSLVQLDARDELAALVPRLAEPPLVTWSVHAALLEAARRFGLDDRAARAHLAEVDDLAVQVQLALLDAAP